MSRKSPQSGIGKITLLVFGLITAAVVYSGYCILPFFYSYYELQNQMDSVMRIGSTLSDAEIREKIWFHVAHLEIPVEPADLKVSREYGMLRVSLEYDEIFFITWQGKDHDLHTFHFHAYSETKVDRD